MPGSDTRQQHRRQAGKPVIGVPEFPEPLITSAVAALAPEARAALREAILAGENIHRNVLYLGGRPMYPK